MIDAAHLKGLMVAKYTLVRASTCEVQNRPELFHEQLTSICWAPIHSVKNHHRLHSSKIPHWGQCRNIESYLKKSGTTNQTNSIQNKSTPYLDIALKLRQMLPWKLNYSSICFLLNTQ